MIWSYNVLVICDWILFLCLNIWNKHFVQCNNFFIVKEDLVENDVQVTNPYKHNFPQDDMFLQDYGKHTICLLYSLNLLYHAWHNVYDTCVIVCFRHFWWPVSVLETSHVQMCRNVYFVVWSLWCYCYLSKVTDDQSGKTALICWICVCVVFNKDSILLIFLIVLLVLIWFVFS